MHMHKCNDAPHLVCTNAQMQWRPPPGLHMGSGQKICSMTDSFLALFAFLTLTSARHLESSVQVSTFSSHRLKSTQFLNISSIRVKRNACSKHQQSVSAITEKGNIFKAKFWLFFKAKPTEQYMKIYEYMKKEKKGQKTGGSEDERPWDFNAINHTYSNHAFSWHDNDSARDVEL